MRWRDGAGDRHLQIISQLLVWKCSGNPPESSELASEVEEYESPGDKREGGVAGGETLST